jgi:hypothetical protein
MLKDIANFVIIMKNKEEYYSDYVVKLEVIMCLQRGLNPNPFKDVPQIKWKDLHKTCHINRNKQQINLLILFHSNRPKQWPKFVAHPFLPYVSKQLVETQCLHPTQSDPTCIKQQNGKYIYIMVSQANLLAKNTI